MANYQDRHQRFRALHEGGFFVLPNPWDGLSAKRLERMGFQALASTSAGLARSLCAFGRQLSLEEIIRNLNDICDNTSIPINADFGSGYGNNKEEIEASVSRALSTGISGISIEDRDGAQLFSLEESLERLKAAARVIAYSGQNITLVARSEALMLRDGHLGVVLERLKAFSAAGADCLYAPGLTTYDEIRLVVEAVAPKPVNVLLRPTWKLDVLAGIGVRRASTGGSLTALTWKAFEEAAEPLRKLETELKCS